MAYYAGLDVSKKLTSICVIDDQKKIIYESSVKSCPDQIAKELLSFREQLEIIGLEAGASCFWLSEGIRDHGLPVHVIDSRRVADVLSTMNNKTDRNDARGIADIMRAGFYTPVHDRSAQSIELSTVLRARAALVEDRTALKNRIRGFLKSYGLKFNCPGLGSFLKAVEKELPGISQSVQVAIRVTMQNLERVDQSITEIEEALDTLIEEDKRIDLIKTIPGVGNITAAAFIAAIDDPERFRKRPWDVGAYLGLTPKQYSSGETQRQGRISKAGPKYVRSLLYEAAISMLTRSQTHSWLKAWGLKLSGKKGLKKAAVAVARRLAVIMIHMLLSGEVFRYSRFPKDESADKKKTQAKKRTKRKAFSSKQQGAILADASSA